MQTLKLSVVVPVLDEKDNVRILRDEVASVMDKQGWSYEIIFVDDGSTDGTVEVLSQLAREDSHVRLLVLGCHSGKAAALACGFKNVRGELTVTLDGDLQDQPQEIIKLWKKLESTGVDMVTGWKKVRHDPWHKLISSKLFNGLVRLITGAKFHDLNCGIKLYRSEVVREIPMYGELHRFIPVLAMWRGFRVGEEVVEHRARQFGRSKFGLFRMFGMVTDILTILFLMRYENKPSHLFSGSGLIFLAAGACINIDLLIRKLTGGTIAPNYPYMILGITLLMIGVQFVFFGLLSEMIVYLSRREQRVSERVFAVHEEKK